MPMGDREASVMEKEIDNTTYIVESTVGTEAKETVYEKLKKLILQDSSRHTLFKETYQ